ncbi:MAG: EAL domain-containing protein [Pseudomonadota bacterium]
MTEKRKERRGKARARFSEPVNRIAGAGSPAKEYNYVLHVTHDEAAFLNQYKTALAADSARFAEGYYNYLFDNPDIADVLYLHERSGGDISDLIRHELQLMLDIFASQDADKRENTLLEAGRDHLKRGIKPVWITGAYRMFLEYVFGLVNEIDIKAADKLRLETILIKQIMHDHGLMIEGYWAATLDTARDEIARATEQYRKVEDLLAGLPHLVWSVDVEKNRLLYASYRMHELYEPMSESPIPFLDDTNEEDRELLLTAWQQALKGSTAAAEVRMALADVPERWYRLLLHPSMNRRGRVVRMYCLLEDINNDIRERKQLEQLSTMDKLTGLPNRALWNDHLSMALAASRRVPGSQVAVISLDINQFKMYNDTLGRNVGDMLLREIAERLDSVVRESDSLARLGGDQFGILLQPVNDARSASERVITQVLDSFDAPFSCSGKQLCVNITLGAACFPDHGTSEEVLLTNAESAMYRGKRNGLPYQFYDPVNDVSPVEQLRYSGQIQGALDNDEFELHYQPQVDLKTSRLTGAEALLRWQHPQEGMVLPQRIIPVAEQLGMISPITDWVLITALRQCKDWLYNGARVPVSVNVSARSFQNPRLLEKIQTALQEAAVDGDCLEIEITEATLMQDLDRATSVLSALSDSGVTVAIDDFGTGYSSLSYLKRLPIHTLKIDQSFIMGVAFDKQDIAIVQSIINLGHNLGYKVVAEGVENGMAWDMLNKLGCDAAQGYHISKPLSEDRFSGWLTDTS